MKAVIADAETKLVGKNFVIRKSGTEPLIPRDG
jgi:hypothetical protein